MYQLHYSPGTASMSVHWLLIEMQIPHELVLVDFSNQQQKSPEYLKMNPTGVVPTLIVDGQPIGEFAAICMYLADKYPDKQLAPSINSDRRAEYNQWMFYLSNTIQPAFRSWFYPQEFSPDLEFGKEMARSKIESCFTRVDKHLSDDRKFIMGENKTAADFCMTILLRWSRNMPKPADSWPNLAAFAKRMKSLDSFKELYKREGITDWT